MVQALGSKTNIGRVVVILRGVIEMLFALFVFFVALLTVVLALVLCLFAAFLVGFGFARLFEFVVLFVFGVLVLVLLVFWGLFVMRFSVVRLSLIHI